MQSLKAYDLRHLRNGGCWVDRTPDIRRVKAADSKTINDLSILKRIETDLFKAHLRTNVAQVRA